MKKVAIFCSFLCALVACNQEEQTVQNQQEENILKTIDSVSSTTKKTNSEQEKENLMNQKFLITNTSVGLFNMQSNCKNIIQEYNYSKDFSEECIDACCGGTVILWKQDESKENPSIVLYCKEFEDNKTPEIQKMDCNTYSQKFASQDDLFFVCSDNCPSWYYKDSIAGLAVYSSDFKTEEQIGVGSSIEDFLKTFNTVYMTIGWVEEDADAIQLSVDKYPGFSFIVNSDNFKIDWKPVQEDVVEEEYSSKIILHNTECFTGPATIKKIKIFPN